MAEESIQEKAQKNVQHALDKMHKDLPESQALYKSIDDFWMHKDVGTLQRIPAVRELLSHIAHTAKQLEKFEANRANVTQAVNMAVHARGMVYVEDKK